MHFSLAIFLAGLALPVVCNATPVNCKGLHLGLNRLTVEGQPAIVSVSRAWFKTSDHDSHDLAREIAEIDAKSNLKKLSSNSNLEGLQVVCKWTSDAYVYVGVLKSLKSTNSSKTLKDQLKKSFEETK